VRASSRSDGLRRVRTGIDQWLAVDATGNVYLVGSFEDSVSFGAGTPTLAIARRETILVSKWDAATSLLSSG
jgi:hypothetical protein